MRERPLIKARANRQICNVCILGREQHHLPTSFDYISLAVRNLLHKYYEVLCIPSTPVYVATIKPNGLGQLFLYLLLAFHKSKLENRTFVINTSNSPWDLDIQHIVRLSTCQTLYDSKVIFTDSVGGIGGDTPEMFMKHKSFNQKPLMWWYKQLAGFMFQTHSYLYTDPFRRHYVESLIAQKEMNFLKPRTTNINQYYYISLHIRRGDSCVLRHLNTGRPPCFHASKFIDAIMVLVKHVTKPIKILLSTDSDEAEREVRSHLPSSYKVVCLYISRDKYKPQGEKNIEKFDPEKKQNMPVEFWSEMVFLSLGDAFVGSWFSSFINLAYLLSTRSQAWVSVDHSYPCARGGCPSPYTFTKAASCNYYNHYVALQNAGVLDRVSMFMREYQQKLHASGGNCSVIYDISYYTPFCLNASSWCYY